MGNELTSLTNPVVKVPTFIIGPSSPSIKVWSPVDHTLFHRVSVSRLTAYPTICVQVWGWAVHINKRFFIVFVAFWRSLDSEPRVLILTCNLLNARLLIIGFWHGQISAMFPANVSCTTPVSFMLAKQEVGIQLLRPALQPSCSEHRKENTGMHLLATGD